MEVNAASINKSPRLSAFARKHWFPLFLLLLTILTYGLLTYRQGFYLDDWYIILFKEKLGNEGFLLYFSKDRPFLSYPYVALMALFGESAVSWAIFALVMRWLTTCTFWQLLNKLFPEKKKLWIWAAVLFAVYPGFKFHWFAIMYAFAYIFLTFYFLSFFSMAKALENTSTPTRYGLWTLLGLVFLLIGIVPQEYFFGMELFRPVLLWILMKRAYPENRKAVLRKTILHWLPYLALVVGFTAYRILQSSTYAYQVGILDQLAAAPLATLLELAKKAVLSVADALAFSWWKAFKLVAQNRFLPGAIPLLAVVLSGLALLLVGLFPRKNGETLPFREREGWHLMLAGLFLCFVSLIPFYAGGFEVSSDFPWNRFMLALTPGVAIFLTGALEQVFRSDRLKVVLLALVCSVAIGSQYLTSLDFVKNWERQKDFFWQLSWRAPGLEPGTALVTSEISFGKYFSGTALNGPLNLIYSPTDNSENINNIILLLDGPQKEYVPEYVAGIPIDYNLRGLQFTGNTDKLLVFSMPDNNCLRVLSPTEIPDGDVSIRKPSLWQGLPALSRLDTIITDPAQAALPPERFFGPEDRNQWCYYFEKADLARQKQDWAAVIQLYDDALKLDLGPNAASEYVPLFEAFLRSDQVEKAYQLHSQLFDWFPGDRAHWCALFWDVLAGVDVSLADQALVTEMLTREGCR
ncbi:MAG: hypothetical protein AAGU04_04945 [Anaerolineaceae bacterium]